VCVCVMCVPGRRPKRGRPGCHILSFVCVMCVCVCVCQARRPSFRHPNCHILYMYLCVVYVYLHKPALSGHLHMHTCIQKYVCTYKYACMHIHTCIICIYIYTHTTYIYTYLHCLYICIDAYKSTYIRTCTYIHAHTYICTHTWTVCGSILERHATAASAMRIGTDVCMYKCVSICMH
jgi:hypothetical protein